MIQPENNLGETTSMPNVRKKQKCIILASQK